MANKTLLNVNQIKDMDTIMQDLDAAKMTITNLSTSVGTLTASGASTQEQVTTIVQQLGDVADDLTELANNMPKFTILDHAPTQEEIDAAAEGEIIMTYDPADVYTPE